MRRGARTTLFSRAIVEAANDHPVRCVAAARLADHIAVGLDVAPQSCSGLARFAMGRHRYPLAEALWRAVLALDPQESEAELSLARCLLARGSPADSIALLARVLERDPANADAQRDIGIAYLETHEPERAQPHL